MRSVFLALIVVLAGCSKPTPVSPGEAMTQANFERQQQGIDDLRKRGQNEMADEAQKILDDAKRMNEAMSKR